MTVEYRYIHSDVLLAFGQLVLFTGSNALTEGDTGLRSVQQSIQKALQDLSVKRPRLTVVERALDNVEGRQRLYIQLSSDESDADAGLPSWDMAFSQVDSIRLRNDGGDVRGATPSGYEDDLSVAQLLQDGSDGGLDYQTIIGADNVVYLGINPRLGTRFPIGSVGSDRKIIIRYTTRYKIWNEAGDEHQPNLERVSGHTASQIATADDTRIVDIPNTYMMAVHYFAMEDMLMKASILSNKTTDPPSGANFAFPRNRTSERYSDLAKDFRQKALNELGVTETPSAFALGHQSFIRDVAPVTYSGRFVYDGVQSGYGFSRE